MPLIMKNKLDHEAIRRRWPSAHDFYRERDNRTKLELADLDWFSSRPVEIWIDPGAVASSATQQTALVACNLTARWARDVTVRMHPGTKLLSGLRRDGETLLSERVLSEMRGADPFGNFRVGPIDGETPRNVPLRLFVGPWSAARDRAVNIAGDDYAVAARGRIAVGHRGRAIENGPDVETPLATAAAGLAASLGVVDLFKRAVGHAREKWLPDFRWDLWGQKLVPPMDDVDDLPVQQLPPDHGQIMLAGVGAIGSSLIYLLDLLDAKGNLLILDRDRVETSNLNRSLVFDVSHVLEDLPKTEIAERFLTGRRISVERLDGTWHEHGSSIARQPSDVWISFTNEDGAWAELPFQLPPVVLQRRTWGGGLGGGRHIPRREDCTICRMPRPEAIFRGPCAEGEIEGEEAKPPARASLPFLSAASASLVLAELIKLNFGDVRSLPNDVGADLRTGLRAVVGLRRRATEDCRGCNFLRSQAWVNFGGRGRFAHLSA